MPAPKGNKYAEANTTFTPELGTRVCDSLISVGSLRKVCEEDGMPSKTTVFRWLLKADIEDAEEKYIKFRDQYVRARQYSKDYKFDELEHELHSIAKVPVVIDDVPLMVDGKIVETVTTTSVALAKLHLDAFKWQSSKENPKKYGDKISQEVTGPGGGPQVHVITGSEDPKEASRIYKEMMNQE